MFLGLDSVTVQVERTGGLVARRAQVASSLWQRLRGLLGTASLPEGTALIIEPCTSVHMLFMRYPIDVLFCDSGGGVVRVCSELKPWSFSPLVLGACCAVEIPAGRALTLGIQVGDKLTFTSSKAH